MGWNLASFLACCVSETLEIHHPVGTNRAELDGVFQLGEGSFVCSWWGKECRALNEAELAVASFTVSTAFKAFLPGHILPPVETAAGSIQCCPHAAVPAVLP